MRQRRQSLHHNASALSLILMRKEHDNSGYLSVDTLGEALKEADINVDVKGDGMDLVMRDITEKSKGVNIQKLMRFLGDQHITLKMDSCKQWNKFRMKVISAKK